MNPSVAEVQRLLHLEPPPGCRGHLWKLSPSKVKQRLALFGQHQWRFILVEHGKLYWFEDPDVFSKKGHAGAKGFLDMRVNEVDLVVDAVSSLKFSLLPRGGRWLKADFTGAEEGRKLVFDVSSSEYDLHFWVSILHSHISYGEDHRRKISLQPPTLEELRSRRRSSARSSSATRVQLLRPPHLSTLVAMAMRATMQTARGLAAASVAVGAATAAGAGFQKGEEGRFFKGFDESARLKELAAFVAESRFSGPLHSSVAQMRFNTLLPQPPKPKYRLCVIGFTAPGGWSMNTDKNKHGVRYDSIPIANGVIKTGNACDLLQYEISKHTEFEAKLAHYDAFIVRVNPGQLDNTQKGAQQAFDHMMEKIARSGKPVWSSPDVQTRMGAKDALVMIKDLSCGLVDTAAYYNKEELEVGFKKSCAFQPRVIKQNRGSSGEGIWLCWLQDKPYCKNFGDAMLKDSDKLKLMEMNDNHVEYHTVGEFLEFCVNGPTPAAGTWKSVFPGRYLAGGKEAGGQLVDQRLLPRIVEGEVRMLMVKDTLFMIVHKIPDGGMSAVGGIAKYKFYEPGCPEFADLENKFLGEDLSKLKSALGIEGQPLPLLWTADFIPKDAEDGTPGATEYVVGEFNCSCVGISQLLKGCGPDKGVEHVPTENYLEATRLTDLMGRKAIEILNELDGRVE